MLKEFPTNVEYSNGYLIDVFLGYTNSELVLSDCGETLRWAEFQGIEIDYSPLPTTLTLPYYGPDIIINRMGLFFARRDLSEINKNLQKFEELESALCFAEALAYLARLWMEEET